MRTSRILVAISLLGGCVADGPSGPFESTAPSSVESSGQGLQLAGLAPDASWAVQEMAAGAELGWAARGAGDVNGDG